MRLCEEKRESGHRTRRADETRLEFLYRSDRAEIPPICQLMEDWFQFYPSEEQDQLLRRLSSKNDGEFSSAFFEMYLFTLLRKLRFDTEVPRSEAEGQKVEDFRAFRQGKLTFRLEAKYVGQQEQHAWQDRFQRQLQDSLHRARADDIWFSVRIRGEFHHQPAYAKVCQRFNRWYEQHREDIVAALAAGQPSDSLPKFAVEEAGARVALAPMFLKGDKGSADGPVGLWSGGGRWMQTDDKLRRALRRKASRYGTMTVPFIVAVSLYETANDADIGNALFGDEVFTIRQGPEGPVGDPIPSRKPNGFWLGPKGPHNTRVSAILLATELFPWSVAARQPIIYHNPWAEHPLSPGSLPLAQMVPDKNKGRYETCDGQPIHEVLGLPATWPRHATPWASPRVISRPQ